MKRNTPASRMALGGLMAALAVVIMVMGTLIPVATFVCPVICILILNLILRICGKRTAWAWYFAVSILSVLLSPDKEAALIFGFLGSYPMLRSWMEQRAGKWLWKAAYFNLTVLSAYWLMLKLFGITQVVDDFSGASRGLTVILLVLGNITFFLLDRLLRFNGKMRNVRK